MKTWALIKSGIVVNVALGDDEWAKSIGKEWDLVLDVTLLSPRPGPGWTWNGSAFAPPAPDPTAAERTEEAARIRALEEKPALTPPELLELVKLLAKAHRMGW